MAFVDQATIEVKAGNGGNGIVAFRREKFVANGGPFGGDGGRGGSVVMVVDEGLRTLMDFRYNRHYKAKHGVNGMSKGMTGRSADDLIVKVPGGTIIRNLETGEVLGDLTEPGQRLVIAKGGRGGRGNIRFATPKNPAPEISENGEPGQEFKIGLELQLLADVGLVGFPSVGKSTLMSVITNAKPKIGAYHFTTIDPNIGMVRLEDGRDFVMADLPGLIEGASDGVGLGFQFLRHVERTRVLLHLVAMGGDEFMDEEQTQTPIDAFHAINKELASYDESLLERPQIVVATKMDLPDAQERFEAFKKALETDDSLPNKPQVLAISSVSHAGLQPLIQATASLLDETPAFVPEVEETAGVTYTFNPDETPAFVVNQDEDGVWILSGDKIEKLFKMTNTQHEQSMVRFARQLRGLGVDDALREAGAKDGDVVQILDFTFDFIE
ncbi:GTPase ObgE [Furfurilactobacillus siliginis]|nr:GTPase ObgE [Furfurilactobacillus siliginis]GEK28186.1 GTPase Obg [Furfurilactobacillus siliginis]